MDPNYLNSLRQYLDFYNQNNPQGSTGMPDLGGMSMSSGALAQRNAAGAANQRGAGLAFAAQMMRNQSEDQPPPNFFASQSPSFQTPAYVQPQYPTGQMPQRSYGDVGNYLRQILGRQGQPMTSTIGIRG